jgi:membrane-bound lytic murein transglycosylase D
MEAKIHNAQLDTMCMKDGVHMSTIATLASWDIDEIKELNPIYKTAFIPKMKPARCLTGPMDKINLLVSLEDSLYSLEKSIFGPKVTPPKPTVTTPPDTANLVNVVPPNNVVVDTIKPKVNQENLQYHKVKSGENLKNIAVLYGVTIEQMMEWNALQTTNIYVGQKLKVYSNKTVTPTPPKPNPPAKKYYTVKTGDTFSKIAQRNNLTQTQLKNLNPGIKINNIVVGQRIRIK